MKTKTVQISPDITLMKKMGQKGYKVWQAVSELVDNSLDARREDTTPLNISIDFDPDNPSDYQWIRIRDNGKGMTLDEFEKCMILAHEPKTKPDQLSKFGMGLKTSCASLGTHFTIKTKHYKNKGDEVYSLTYDDSKFINNGKWEVEIQTNVDKNFEPGTEIVIKGLQERGINLYYQKIDRIIDRLSQQFGAFINQGELAIQVDYMKRKSPVNVEPFVWPLIKTKEVPNGKYNIDFELPVEEIEGNKRVVKIYRIKGWFGFRRPRSVKGAVSQSMFGFDLFWRKRLVSPYAKVGVPDHPEWATVVGELQLDDFPISNDKRTFLWERKPLQELLGHENVKTGEPDYHRSPIYKILKQTRDKFKKEEKQKRILKEKIKQAQIDGKISLVAQRQLKKKLDELIPIDVVKNELDKEIHEIKTKKTKQVEPKEIEKASVTKIEIEKSKKEEIYFQEYDIDFEDGFAIKIKDSEGDTRKYTTFHNLGHDGTEGEWYIRKLREGGLEVITNVDHPLIEVVDDLEQYYDMHIIEALTHSVVALKNLEIDKFFEIRDEIMRKYAHWKRQKKLALEAEKAAEAAKKAAEEEEIV